MKITKKGRLPGDKVIEFKCSNCGTEFEVRVSGCDRWSSPRNEWGYKHKCPLAGCGKEVWVDG